ncbi:hypothetical protein A2773_06615 [Candidatus Gottesmanbacteria bacterium RIFCSPHIGHO2_01_FULL_39_10]|uniref:Uncharacterized protein n=1 Tax=Candidatus Gottesmanbacteria bacterium RIFCSPHIGHO2_01_FULL_39_10 TaxID=1798375 RepID=A0A1F5ZQ69_9BACT|nr:MAG: hypothetical protein A2773_06615 [Candidatus Gottesmanbacteria bacterium RIFCSPHIGHO2_01_FULL_39_10]
MLRKSFSPQAPIWFIALATGLLALFMLVAFCAPQIANAQGPDATSTPTPITWEAFYFRVDPSDRTGKFFSGDQVSIEISGEGFKAKRVHKFYITWTMTEDTEPMIFKEGTLIPNKQEEFEESVRFSIPWYVQGKMIIGVSVEGKAFGTVEITVDRRKPFPFRDWLLQ